MNVTYENEFIYGVFNKIGDIMQRQKHFIPDHILYPTTQISTMLFAWPPNTHRNKPGVLLHSF